MKLKLLIPSLLISYYISINNNCIAQTNINTIEPITNTLDTTILLITAQQKIEIKKYNDAITILNTIIDYDPTSINAITKRAFCYYQLQKYAIAITDYTKAISMNSKDKLLWNNRADSYFAIQKFYLAAYDYTKSIAMDSTDATVFYKRAMSNYAINKFTSAFKDVNKSLQLNTNYIVAYQLRADVYYSLGKYNEAVKDFNQVLKLEPDNITTLRRMVMVCCAADKYNLAKKYNEQLNQNLELQNLTLYSYEKKWINATLQFLIIDNYTNALPLLLDVQKDMEQMKSEKNAQQRMDYYLLLNKIAVVYKQLKDTNTAIVYGMKARAVNPVGIDAGKKTPTIKVKK